MSKTDQEMGLVVLILGLVALIIGSDVYDTHPSAGTVGLVMGAVLGLMGGVAAIWGRR